MSQNAAPTFDAAAIGRRVLEIEAKALLAQAAALDGPFSEAVALISNLKGRLILTGIGKSGHVAKKIAATLASTGTPAFFVHATEASHGDLGMITPDDVILALSKSGETRELGDVLSYAKRFSVPLIGMTASKDSALGQASDILLLLAPEPEATDYVNAPTTSTTLQIALGDALGVALLEKRGFGAADFKNFHPGGKLGAALRTVKDLMHKASELPLVSEAAGMPEALLVMTEKRFGCVGVTDAGGALVGLITDGDLRRHMDGLMTRSASEVMTRAPKTVTLDMLAGEALAVLNAKAITVLFVVEDQKPVGILHIHDVLRAGVA